MIRPARRWAVGLCASVAWRGGSRLILRVPWSGDAERAAAGRFLDYLMSESIQRRALDYGFRPGNPSISVRSPDSPLITNEASGIRIDVPLMAEPPKAEVVNGLLSSFERVAR